MIIVYIGKMLPKFQVETGNLDKKCKSMLKLNCQLS